MIGKAGSLKRLGGGLYPSVQVNLWLFLVQIAGCKPAQSKEQVHMRQMPNLSEISRI